MKLIYFSLVFSAHRVVHGTRGHSLKLFYCDPRVSVRAHCFPIRVISLRNRLPISNVSAKNIQNVTKARRLFLLNVRKSLI